MRFSKEMVYIGLGVSAAYGPASQLNQWADKQAFCVDADIGCHFSLYFNWLRHRKIRFVPRRGGISTHTCGMLTFLPELPAGRHPGTDGTLSARASALWITSIFVCSDLISDLASSAVEGHRLDSCVTSKLVSSCSVFLACTSLRRTISSSA